MRLCDVGEAIEEVMTSYEVELDGKVHTGMLNCLPSVSHTLVSHLPFIFSETYSESEWSLHRTISHTRGQDSADRERRRSYENGGT